MQEYITVHRVVKTYKLAQQYVEPHTHKFFHFIYYFGGHAQVQVEDQRYTTGPDTLIMVPPDTVHSIISLDISTNLDIKFTCSPGLARRICALPMCIQKVDEQASGILRSVLEEAVGQAPGYNEMADLRMYELILVLERLQSGRAMLWQKCEVPLRASDNENICAALNWIEERLETPLRVSDLADHCGYSANYFRLFFKEHMGVTPNTYINQRKISRAKEWMLYSELNVTQISERLGYQSIHYFSRLFKKLTGLAPTEYIGRVRNNQPINLVHNENTPEGEFELPVKNLSESAWKSRTSADQKREGGHVHEGKNSSVGDCPL